MRHGSGAWKACFPLERVEELGRINGYAVDGLYSGFVLKSVADEDLGGIYHDCGQDRLAVFVEETEVVVIIQKRFVDRMSGFGSEAEAGRNGTHESRSAVGLETHERPARDNVVEGAYHFNVGIEIKTSVFVEDSEACVVAHESIFAGRISLGGIRN